MVQKRQYDHINEAAVCIDEIHANIHRGIMFAAGHSAEGIADDGVIELLISVGSTRSCHVQFTGAAGGNHEFELFEATTTSAAGTAVTPVNRNRFSPTVAVTTVTHTPTITGDGTKLVGGLRPGGTGGNSIGSTTKGFAEWVLATDTVYLARLINRAGNAQLLSLEMDFYEPDPDN